jgi:hypothetical protein
MAAAVAALTPSAMVGNFANTNEHRAYYLALSGLNYWSKGKTGTFSLDGDSFTLIQAGPDASGYYTVTSIGTAWAKSGYEANVLLTARRSGLDPITFASDIEEFTTPVLNKTTNNASAILVYAANQGTGATTRYASGWMLLGNGKTNTSAATWYAGDHGTCPGGVCPDGACLDGKCAFAKGLRAYFGFNFSSSDSSKYSTLFGEGFTFAVMNAGNDPQTAAGGPATGSRGEYLGYAGPGPSGKGIQPPKMAVEVDVYPNNKNTDPTDSNSRNDYSNANHVAVVYWGASGTLYDDNMHGAGSAPQNPSGASTGYYEKAKQTGLANWLEDGDEHAMRVEIQRATNTDGSGSYTVLVWVDPAGGGATDVTADYTAETPVIKTTAALSKADHTALGSIYFGFTEGTGNTVQTMTLHDFALDFRR